MDFETGGCPGCVVDVLMASVAAKLAQKGDEEGFGSLLMSLDDAAPFLVENLKEGFLNSSCLLLPGRDNEELVETCTSHQDDFNIRLRFESASVRFVKNRLGE